MRETPFPRGAADVVPPPPPPPPPRIRNSNRFINQRLSYSPRRYNSLATRCAVYNPDIDGILYDVWNPRRDLNGQWNQLCVSYRNGILVCWGSSPYHPQCNEMCERFNGAVKSMKVKTFIDKTKWDDDLPVLLFVYRDSSHTTTCFSPFELVFNSHVAGPLTFMFDNWTARNKLN